MKKLAITLSVLMATTMVLPSFADKIEGQTLFAVTAPTASSITLNDNALVDSYVETQLSAYNITMSQYLALSPDKQREVMSLPGRQVPFSRQARRSFIPLKKTVPASIISGITPGEIISSATIDKYGVSIPTNLNGVEKGVLPVGYKRVLIGDHYILLDGGNKVLKKAEI